MQKRISNQKNQPTTQIAANCECECGCSFFETIVVSRIPFFQTTVPGQAPVGGDKLYLLRCAKCQKTHNLPDMQMTGKFTLYREMMNEIIK